MKKRNYLNDATKLMKSDMELSDFLQMTEGQDIDELKKKVDIFLALKESTREDARLYLEADKQHNEKEDLEIKFEKQKFDEHTSKRDFIMKIIVCVGLLISGAALDKMIDFISMLPNFLK